MAYPESDEKLMFWFFVTFGAVKYANRLYLWSQPAYLRE